MASKRCKSEEFDICIDDGTGKCTNCGVFLKGNVHGTNSRRRDAVKMAVKDAVSPAEAKALLSKLMNSKNENVQLKALYLYLDRVLGKSITPIVTNVEKENNEIVSDSVKSMLDELLDVSNG